MRTLATVQHACARRGVRGLGLLQDHATREKLELRCKDEIRISTKRPLAVLYRHRLHTNQGGPPITSRSDKAPIFERQSVLTQTARVANHIAVWKPLEMLVCIEGKFKSGNLCARKHLAQTSQRLLYESCHFEGGWSNRVRGCRRTKGGW